MEQQIRYAKTEDGVDIAFTTYGDGVPLVIPPNLTLTHVIEEAQHPLTRGFYERLSRRLQLIRYDPRGLGMSQRDAIDFSGEAGERDLAAVVNKLGLDRFALYGHVLAGETPMAFAAHHPERVASFVVWVGQTIMSMPDKRRQFAAMRALMESEWELYLNVNGRLVYGWDSPHASAYTSVGLAGSSPAALRLAQQAVSGASLDWAAKIHVPALVAHLAGARDPAGIARSLASRMPMARLIAIPGHTSSLAPFVNDNEILVAAIADFVEAHWSEGAAVRAPELNLGAMRAILWTDIEDHTLLMQRVGDSKGRDLLREHDRITREALSTHSGTEVKAMGDGFMAWFSSAQQALTCAVELQRAFAARNASAAEPLLIRAAINAGEPIVEDDDLFGTSVIAAARICREGAGGQIVVSDVVRQLVAGKRFLFTERGMVALKGFEEPLRLFDVRWQE
jgi:class 3 adenylate cyclase